MTSSEILWPSIADCGLLNPALFLPTRCCELVFLTPSFKAGKTLVSLFKTLILSCRFDLTPQLNQVYLFDRDQRFLCHTFATNAVHI